MGKRIFSVLIPVLVLVMSAPASASSYQPNNGSDENNGSSTLPSIQQGLCVGASLDLSQESRAKCARETGQEPTGDNETNDNYNGAPTQRHPSYNNYSQQPNYNNNTYQQPGYNTPTHRYPSYDKEHNGSNTYPENNGSTYQPRYPSYDKSHTENQNPNSYNNTAPQQYNNAPTHRYPSYDKEHQNTQGTSNYNNTTFNYNSTTRQHTGTYAALGDSVAAGQGLPNSVKSQNGNCGRTQEAYPYAVAHNRGLQINDLACSGATMGDLFTKQKADGSNIAPQLNSAFQNGTPQLITITAGANDIHWDDFVRKCYTGTCGTGTDQAVVNGLMATLRLKMQFLYNEIQQRSKDTKPTVIVTGYYVPLSDKCAQSQHITPDETSWLNEQTDNLNQTLEDGAKKSGYATFAPVDFSGHDMCSQDPWVQGPNDPAPFHPTTKGQQAIANAVDNQDEQ